MPYFGSTSRWSKRGATQVALNLFQRRGAAPKQCGVSTVSVWTSRPAWCSPNSPRWHLSLMAGARPMEIFHVRITVWGGTRSTPADF